MPQSLLKDLSPGQTYFLQVRASMGEAYSEWSPIVNFVAQQDVTPPNLPSTPTITTSIRSIAIDWNGLDSTGGAQPVDFDRCEVHVNPGSATFTPSILTKAGQLGPNGGVYTYESPNVGNQTYSVRLVAYDHSNNASPASAFVTGTTSDALDTNLVYNGAFEDGLSGWTDSWQVNGAAPPWFVDNSAGVVISGSSAASINATGATGNGMASRAFPVVAGESLSVSAFVRQTGATKKFFRVTFGTTDNFAVGGRIAGTPAVPTEVKLLNLNGTTAATPTPVSSAGFSDIFSSYNFPASSTWYKAVAKVLVPTGATWARLLYYTWTGTVVASVDSVDLTEVRRAITGTHLAADSIDGKTITGAFIRTAATGQRWEISGLPADKITAFSNIVGETPGYLQIYPTAGTSGGFIPILDLYSASPPGGNGCSIRMQGQDVNALAPGNASLIQINSDMLRTPNFTIDYGFGPTLAASFAVDVKYGSVSFPRGLSATATPVRFTAGDYGVTPTTIATVTLNTATGRNYMLHAALFATQVTLAGTPTVKVLNGATELFRLQTGASIISGGTVYGTPTSYYIIGDGTSYTFTVTAQSSAGALRIPVQTNLSGNFLLVQDLGGN